MDMQCPVEFDTLPDCTCPHEHWHIGHAGCCLDIHFEEDGSVHVTLDAYDWQDEIVLHGVSTLAEASAIALAWGAGKIGETYP